MTRPFSLIGCLVGAVCVMFAATQEVHAQEDMWNHVYWRSLGSYEGQERSGRGLSYLGKLNDTIPHAIAIGEYQSGKLVSSLVYNNRPGDTARHYEFPGQSVYRANFNGDAYPDFVCWNSLQKTITILFGTPKVDSFSNAMVLYGSGENFVYLDKGLLVADVDSDGYDDLVVSDIEYDYTSTSYHGRVAVWRGGVTMDTVPSFLLVGHDYPDWSGGFIAVGHIKDYRTPYLCELRYYGNPRFSAFDTAKVFLYPLGRAFSLKPIDSILLTHDTLMMGIFSFGYALIDIDGDGIDDICTTGTDLHYKPSLLVDATITVYKGGTVVDPHPTYLLHRPFQEYGGDFGETMIDVGDVSGKGYHALLATDWTAYQNSVGAAFLFDIGKGLIDSCVGYAEGQGSDANFGIEAIPLGDVNKDGRADFMIGSNNGRGMGEFIVFLGDTCYGWTTVGLEEPLAPPIDAKILSNYPNPFSTSTTVSFSLPQNKQSSGTATLEVFDLYGRRVRSVDCAALRDGKGFAHVSGSDLAVGCYLLKLTHGTFSANRMISIVR